MEEKFLHLKEKNLEVGGFIFEAALGVGGNDILNKTYIRKILDLVKKEPHRGLIICDEVQTGFGRSGKHFWGFRAIYSSRI